MSETDQDTGTERMPGRGTLLLEESGAVPRGGLSNCRIRTAFTNDAGKRIYFEAQGVSKPPKGDRYRKAFAGIPWEDYGSTDFAFEITGQHDDINQRRLPQQQHAGRPVDLGEFPYTSQGLLDYINRQFGCSFDAVKIVNDGSYRVHGPDGYTFGDGTGQQEPRAVEDRNAVLERIRHRADGRTNSATAARHAPTRPRARG